MGTGERALERCERLEAVLRAQERRVVAGLVDDEPLEATPILRADETLRCEEYVTLVYEFHHVILPELAADGLVRFDRRTDRVRRGERFEAAVPRAPVDERR